MAKPIGGASNEASEVRCVHTLNCPIFDIIGNYCPDGLMPGTRPCADAIKEANEAKARLNTINRNKLIGSAE